MPTIPNQNPIRETSASAPAPLTSMDGMLAAGYYKDENGNWFDADGNPVQ